MLCSGKYALVLTGEQELVSWCLKTNNINIIPSNEPITNIYSICKNESIYFAKGQSGCYYEVNACELVCEDVSYALCQLLHCDTPDIKIADVGHLVAYANCSIVFIYADHERVILRGMFNKLPFEITRVWSPYYVQSDSEMYRLNHRQGMSVTFELTNIDPYTVKQIANETILYEDDTLNDGAIGNVKALWHSENKCFYQDFNNIVYDLSNPSKSLGKADRIVSNKNYVMITESCIEVLSETNLDDRVKIQLPNYPLQVAVSADDILLLLIDGSVYHLPIERNRSVDANKLTRQTYFDTKYVRLEQKKPMKRAR